MNFLEPLLRFDISTLFFFNRDCSSEFLDKILPFLSHIHNFWWFQYFILPALLIFWFYKERKRALRVFLALVITGAVADSLAYRVFKPMFARTRPNNSQTIGVTMRLGYGPKSYSFPSNHATNGFAVASVVSWYYPPLKWTVFSLALITSLSRIYAGVHFPSDILGGALFGLLIAYLLKRFLFTRYKIFSSSQRKY